MHRLACPVRGRVDNTEPRVHPVVGVEVRVNVNEREWTLCRRERTQDRKRDRVITADSKRARSGGRDFPEPGLDVLDRPVGDHELRHDDVCIVGGGFTGLWTALWLKEREPSLDVVMVEADVCGAGASGRNGGFVLSWWAKFLALERLCGAVEAVRLARASAAGVTEIGAFCAENSIDAHFRRAGWLWTATSPAQLGAWDDTLGRLEELGERPFVRLEPEEVARRAASPVHLAGVFEPTAATVHPALLARGLRRVALERGVRLFERSPVRQL